VGVADVPELAPTALKRRLDAAAPLVLLDVREDEERSYCKIELPDGVIDLHIPLREVPARIDEIEEAARLGAVVVYCHHGQRSMVAAAWLTRRGVEGVENLAGGIDAWSLAVDPATRRY
jgi:rhodanese-related sulfurtransferase